MRHPLPLLLALIISLSPAISAGGDVTVMFTKAEALAAVFPEADSVLELRHILSSDEIEAIERTIHNGLDEGGFYTYRATRGDEVVGYAVVVSQIGKVRPITHIVGVNPDGEVGTVAVMIYRESHGHEIANERYMDQYRGKRLDDPIRIGRDIVNIAGATLSGHAICRGVRKALGVVSVLFLEADEAGLAQRLSAATDVTPDVLTERNERSTAQRQTPAAVDSTPVSNPDGSLRLERRVMGTLCSVQAYPDGSGLDEQGLYDAVTATLDEIERIDGVLSDWRNDTPLSRFNRMPSDQSIELERDMAAWLADARHWNQATLGAFDPAVGALVSAWNLRSSSPCRPDERGLAEARSASGLSLIVSEQGRARRCHDGVLLDPGASGKGYALDRAAVVLAEHGVQRALISFRSTMLALGPPPGAESWSIPVVHDGPGEEVARIELVDAALSVSGGSMRAFDDHGVSRGHVIDPRTGVPVSAGRLAWVLYETASGSDALATALLVTGPGLATAVGATGGFLEHAEDETTSWPLSP
jgi:thiamine biosynthesis lipoprotein ApbE/Na+-translocating ferredoxin:NAD+ oxidoreductase RnfG subunit